MSTKELTNQLSKIRKSIQGESLGEAGLIASVRKMVTKAQEIFDNMDPDDKKTMKDRLNGTLSQFRERRKALKAKAFGSLASTSKPNIANRAMGGSMGGGMNPMGRSPDPTVQSVTGYNPNKPMMRKKGGAIKRRGGGIAKRGMGIAK